MAFGHDIEPLSKQLTIVVGLTVVGFMAFGLALSFYRNILFQETLKDIEGRNRMIVDQIDGGYRELEYYRSDQYKDKFAKENLGRLNPGEKVLIITKPPKPVFPDMDESQAERDRREAAYLELLRQMPILEHWRLYLFHQEKIEELKRAL